MDRIFLILLYHKRLDLYSHIFKYLQEIYGKTEKFARERQKYLSDRIIGQVCKMFI